MNKLDAALAIGQSQKYLKYAIMGVAGILIIAGGVMVYKYVQFVRYSRKSKVL